MNHDDGIDECWQGVQHGIRAVGIQWLTELLYGIQELEIVAGLIGCICDVAVQITPLLQLYT